MPLSSVNAAYDVLKEAQRVLTLEADSLLKLKKTLDDQYIKIIHLLLNTEGRIILTGIGKSGHIARKITATLASTGSPSFFVHPAEAAHGDLGMIEAKDVVIALSNSGETPELGPIVTYTRRFKIPLVAMTQNRKSTLAQSADEVLLLPKLPEACPLSLAPTTSTTMMLALGDAIAMSLLTAKGFSAKDFGIFHPGGKLGRQLMKVQDLMHKQETLPLVSPQTPMSDALITMTQKTFGCLGIVSKEGQLQGIITDGDLRRHMGASLLTSTASEIMTSHPVTTSPGALAVEALNVMNEKAITSLFVLNEDKVPVGIIRLHDCLKVGLQ